MVSIMSERHEWSAGETDVLARAVVRAPSVHNTQPWSLELAEGQAALYERADLALPFHDLLGRDRSISCGAAVEHLELGMHVLGVATDLRLLPDPADPSVVARLFAAGSRVPTDVDLHRYSAIARRRSYRHRFAATAVSDYARKDLIAAASSDGVTVKPLHGNAEYTALADLLEYAGVAARADRGYQRELALWTIRDERSHVHGAGIAGSALPASTLPWAGIVRARTSVPDRQTLAERLAGETVLVFGTAGDARIDHIRVGMAMERTWLAAVDMGLVAAVQTQPLHLSEVRASLATSLELPGCPQLLMRVGHAAGPVPQSPRRREAELLRPSPRNGNGATPVSEDSLTS